MIVAIHGAGDAPAQWDPLRALLPNEELLAWVAPTALDVDYRPLRMAELVACAFAGSAAVVGFSWGAPVAARFAAAHPPGVAAFVLIEGAHVDFRVERGAGHDIDYGAVAAALSRTRARTHAAALLACEVPRGERARVRGPRTPRYAGTSSRADSCRSPVDGSK